VLRASPPPYPHTQAADPGLTAQLELAWPIGLLYRAIDCDGRLIDTMLSELHDMVAAQTFFRSARAASGLAPDRVTTDGHGSYPRAIRSTLGRRVVHRTSAYENNRLE
jgi:putative transposase